MAQPTLAVLLTGLPRVWAGVRERMTRFRRALTRLNIKGAYAFHAEPNPNDAHGAHCHLWWRGEDLPRSLVAEVAGKAGIGHAFVKKATPADQHHERPTIEYGMKMVLRTRPASPTAMWPEAASFLELNNGRLVHTTHAFWQDWVGDPIVGGVRVARTSAHRWARSERWDFEAAAAVVT